MEIDVKKATGFTKRALVVPLCLVLLSLFLQANAQNPYRIWVSPKDSSALPINNTVTGNAELNKIFEDYHIEKYNFLDILDLGYDEKTAIYEIHLKKEYAHWGNSLTARLNYLKVFDLICTPCLNYGGQCASLIHFEAIDNSLLPCSPTRSCNDKMNAILARHNVLSYEQSFPYSQSLSEVITISYYADNPINLYNDLLSLNDLLQYLFLDCDYNANLFILSTTEFETMSSVVVSPNPVQDYMSISGVDPQWITLYDAIGRIVFTQTNCLDKIDMSYFPKGLYLLHIISDKGIVYTKKLIKQ